MTKLIDLTGKRFGRLVVMELFQMGKYGAIWKCKCDCGNEKNIGLQFLTKGKSTSCGCYRKENLSKIKSTHGFTKGGKAAPEYNSWCDMLKRCYNKRCKKYADYGDRGIVVCDRWKKSFENFIEDMGERPHGSNSIDRINVNGNYEPSNCRWSNPIEQATNRRVKKTNKIGVSGVWFNEKTKQYRVSIGINRKNITIGRYDYLEDAVSARKEAEFKYWGKSS